MVGFRIQNQESLNSEYICSCCSLLLRDPVQFIDCGHRLCLSCVDEQEGDTIICPKCYEKTSREKLKPDRGFRNDIQSFLIICVLCSWNGILKNYQDHLDHSHPNPTCGYCGNSFVSVDDLNRHQLYICEKMNVYCPLKEFGCTEMILRINLNEHYRSEQHQKTLINVVHQLKSINHPKISLQMTTDPINIKLNTTIELQEIPEAADILSDGITVLNEDRQRLSAESAHHQQALDTLMKNFSTVKTSLQEQNAYLDSVKVNQEILQQDITSMEQKMNDKKTCSYDGTLIWKITNVRAKIAAAQSETQTSIYSPPFYSSSNGYKMCLRLYLCGDGNARQTHMSLFFVLMRGEYDPILKFPFNYKVIFCLYDQTNQQNHIIDAFRPDVTSNSFQRPRSAMNIASGIPKFVPLKTFEQENNPYIRDDTMFIKAMIDFVEMSKSILPYALSLNPGLTTPMQQTMVRQEIEKQQQK